MNSAYQLANVPPGCSYNLVSVIKFILLVHCICTWFLWVCFQLTRRLFYSLVFWGQFVYTVRSGLHLHDKVCHVSHLENQEEGGWGDEYCKGEGRWKYYTTQFLPEKCGALDDRPLVIPSHQLCKLVHPPFPQRARHVSLQPKLWMDH